MVDVLTYVVIVWLELTIFAVVLPIVGFLAIGRWIRMTSILHILRTKFIVHYIKSINGRLVTQIVLDKDVKVFGKAKYIPYRGFWYKINQDKFFLSGTDTAIAHLFNIPEPLSFADTKDQLFKIEKDTEYTSQEVESAITSKVVLDLNKSIYTNKDILTLILVASVGILTAINLYFSYQNGQEITILNNYLSHFVSSTPIPTH